MMVDGSNGTIPPPPHQDNKNQHQPLQPIKSPIATTSAAGRSSIPLRKTCAYSRRRHVVKSLRFRGGAEEFLSSMSQTCSIELKSGESATNSLRSSVSHSTY
ncbi:hypothetical protein TNCV_107141 [Trichonephila clavipes]|nr:hypothetical protein TNCV_107141 [Trichonephila clavipes]